MADLFAQIANFHNLHCAARIVARGKRYRRSAAEFLQRSEHECLRLEEELLSGSWQPGPYRVFRITDPKPRTICAAPFRDRVVHQALVQVVQERFERQRLEARLSMAGCSCYRCATFVRCAASCAGST